MNSREEMAFEAFAAAHRRRLRLMAYDLTRDWDLADDLVQSTLIKIYTAWKRVRSHENPATYARTVLFRTFVDETRRRKRRPETSVATLPDRPAPDDERANNSEGVIQLLSQLPRRQRAVLYLRFVEDLSVEETARVLDCSTGTVKSQTHDALRSLKSTTRTNPNEGTPHV